MLEGFPGEVGPTMDRRAKFIALDIARRMTDISHTVELPTPAFKGGGKYSEKRQAYSAHIPMVDSESGTGFRYSLNIAVQQVVDLRKQLPTMPTHLTFKDPNSIIDEGIKDPKDREKHRRAIEIWYLVCAELHGKLAKQSSITTLVQSILTRYLSSIKGTVIGSREGDSKFACDCTSISILTCEKKNLGVLTVAASSTQFCFTHISHLPESRWVRVQRKTYPVPGSTSGFAPENQRELHRSWTSWSRCGSTPTI